MEQHLSLNRNVTHATMAQLFEPFLVFLSTLSINGILVIEPSCFLN